MDRNELLTKDDLIKVERKLDQLLELLLKKGNSNLRILRSDQVCELLNISQSSLQNLRNRNALPYSKIGGTIFFKYEDIQQLLEKNIVK